MNNSLDEKLLETKTQRFEGFDFLRAIFSMAIVADHAELFFLATIMGMPALTGILYANFSYIAVPVFFQISLFLFYIKSKQIGIKYFIQKRLSKLILLYLFWVTSLTILKVLFRGQVEVNNSEILSARKIFEFIVSGGNSPLYFFFSLIFTTTLAQALVFLFKNIKKSSLKTKINYSLLSSSCFLIFSFSILGSTSSEVAVIHTISNIAKWNYNPLNFLPYIFTTAITAQEMDEGKFEQLASFPKLKLYSLLFLFTAFILFEWNFSNNLNYTRLSLVFGSWLLLYVALLSTRKPPAIIKLISQCSLGIYAFHLFFTNVFFSGDQNVLTPLSHLVPGLSIIAEFLLVLIMSISLTLVFRKTKGLRNFV
ncbi:MAG: acyltransferase [Acaryochloridaceae cyanobacterium SU_2_1]|nr:acyltransferase [Acaryochloridaceae cyanobacterium SU_2_1]